MISPRRQLVFLVPVGSATPTHTLLPTATPSPTPTARPSLAPVATLAVTPTSVPTQAHSLMSTPELAGWSVPPTAVSPTPATPKPTGGGCSLVFGRTRSNTRLGMLLLLLMPLVLGFWKRRSAGQRPGPVGPGSLRGTLERTSRTGHSYGGNPHTPRLSGLPPARERRYPRRRLVA